MKTNGTKEEFIELRAKGYSLAKIAQDVSVSKRTLVEWSKDLYRNNQDLLSATKKATLTQFSDWELYNEHHPNNVMYRYLQIEEEDLTIK